MFASLIAVADSGFVPATKIRRPMTLSSSVQRATAGVGARDDDSELAGRREVGPAEHRRRDERLARRAVLALELAHRRDAVGAHHEMDRARRRVRSTGRRAERDLSDDRVLDEHRDHDLAASRELGNGFRDARPRRLERRRLRSDHVEHAEVVPRVQQPSRHAAAHSTEPDETHACALPSLALDVAAESRSTLSRMAEGGKRRNR